MRAAFCRRFLPPALSVAALYGLNRFLLIPLSAGSLHRFLAWYGNDLLAGALMLSLLNALLAAVQWRPPGRLWAATLYLLCCGLFWEYVTPLYLPRSVSDPWDLAAYWAGGMLLLLLGRLHEKAAAV